MNRLAGAGIGALGIAYGVNASLYTGTHSIPVKDGPYNTCLVEGGHRAVKFNRLTGVGEEIYSEGLHFA